MEFFFVVSAVAGSNNGGDGGSQPILQFHSTRGEHVRLSADRSTARRVDSFCKGIAFSMRTVRPNEKVLDAYISLEPPPPPPPSLPPSLPPSIQSPHGVI